MADSGQHDVFEALEGRAGVEQLLAALPEWVVIYDESLTIRYVSQRPDVVDRAGEGLGRRLRDFIDDPRKADEYEATMRTVFETGERITFETEARNIDGVPGWYLNTVSPLRSDDGSIQLVVMMTRDITDRKEAAEALERALGQEREAVARLRDLDELKSGFVANVVHDLRTPITVIQGFADTLENRWDDFDDAERRRFLSYMSGATRRLMRLVEDVMLASRVESGELPLQHAAFDLGALLRAVARELTHRSRAIVEFSMPGDVIAVGDELRIRQVVVNLLANALRYAPEGTPIEISAERSGSDWTVAVRDHGHGISAKDQEQLFERFSQIDPTEGGHGGSGLGLFICRSIVESHGGHVGVDSEPGHGARFWFTLAVAGG